MLPAGYHSLHYALIRKSWQQCASGAVFTLNNIRGGQITLFLQTLIGISDMSGFCLLVNKKQGFAMFTCLSCGECTVCGTAGLMDSHPGLRHTDRTVLLNCVWMYTRTQLTIISTLKRGGPTCIHTCLYPTATREGSGAISTKVNNILKSSPDSNGTLWH